MVSPFARKLWLRLWVGVAEPVSAAASESDSDRLGLGVEQGAEPESSGIWNGPSPSQSIWILDTRKLGPSDPISVYPDDAPDIVCPIFIGPDIGYNIG